MQGKFLDVLQPAAIKAIPQLAWPNGLQCGTVLNIGLFFDGTGNNHYHYLPTEDTNVWKLSRAYATDNKQTFGFYISGVGTPFKEIGKTAGEFQGGSTGNGGEARIVLGLLQICNAVHQVLNSSTERYDQGQLAALCSTTSVAHLQSPFPMLSPSVHKDAIALEKMGLKCGLVDAPKVRDEFFRKTRDELWAAVTSRKARPSIQAIYLDVFGFSRGAAQARVFVNWLFKYLLHGDKLFGAPSCVRMLGLFDTVSSVGLSDSTIVGTGHNDWGNAEDLRIHPKVKNCVHYVALHELRTSFPSDSVMQGNSLPENCQEHVCPGVHSDVGGGYAAGVQGKGVRIEYDRRYVTPKAIPIKSDGMRLSNVPLNAMYEAAVLSTHGHAPSPWLDLRSSKDLIESFGLADLPTARAAVQSYIDHCGIAKGLSTYKALREHGEVYLAWRYQVNERKGFEQLKSVGYARDVDPAGLKYYRQGQDIFAAQVAKLSGSQEFLDQFKFVFGLKSPSAGLTQWLNSTTEHAKAREIFSRIQKIKVAQEVGEFFDGWVHDSYAGFIGKMAEDSSFKTAMRAIHITVEREGYIRWRQAYQGSTSGVNTSLAPANDDMQNRTA
ncbi:DUF2235 domain-containing protein [Variovorax dokdonensis]|uniref:DUF2235 domain-containing protein n=1 Tax=Variovorax dokdonensis TaxID=344883 RepID=A0ABT7NAD0_9BURK|nr:DUF2235 domain-containing protein [Variovorax dokdonensis]MDM0044897.1 DUF2235 domain-containing protein [Variovorax dokdonensis]